MKEALRLQRAGEPRRDGPTAAAPPQKDYVDRCLRPEFAEQEEERTWQSDPSFESALDPLRGDDCRAAAQEAEKLAGRFPDFDLVYSWWGEALLRQSEFGRARDVLQQGLEQSKRKFFLCDGLASVEWRDDNLAEAVYWWAQSIHCQQSPAYRGGGDVEAYLYMHYVAHFLGLTSVAAALVAKVDAMRAGQIRLESSPVASLNRLVAHQGTPEIREVLVGLQERYLE
jgi:hypothetical protein